MTGDAWRMLIGGMLLAGIVAALVFAYWHVHYSPDARAARQKERESFDDRKARPPRRKPPGGATLLGKGYVDPILKKKD